MLGKRVAALDKQFEGAATESALWLVIQSLKALRGVNLLTATIIMAEIGDLHRFANASQLMAYLGLVPSEHFIGASKTHGSIIKTGNGNGHVRRVLVDAAWTYRHPARKTKHLDSGQSAHPIRCSKSSGTRRYGVGATEPWKARAS